MAEWSFKVTDVADSDLNRIGEPVKARVLEKLKWFRSNFDKIVPEPLGAGWRGFFKLRVGDWRVAYTIEYTRKLVIIRFVDRRDKIYKRKV